MLVVSAISVTPRLVAQQSTISLYFIGSGEFNIYSTEVPRTQHSFIWIHYGRRRRL